ncbi:hypothetical protein JCM3766R1_001551 [Sporobolomyces carnicolor]
MQRTSTMIATTVVRAAAYRSTGAICPSSFRSFSTTRAAPTSAPATPTPPTTTPGASAGGRVGGGAREEPEPKYFVPRSQFGELPVYSDVRNGGTRVLTVIRKVHGDVTELHKDLVTTFLGATTTDSFTKPQTQQIVIKGDWVREVKEWLAHRGF